MKLLLSLAALCALAVVASAGTVQTVDGVTHIQNGAEPPESTEITLLEAFRLGGYSEDPDEFFGVIADALVDPDGNVYLLDMQLNEIKIFDSEGGYINTIGREGEGPGEFRRPVGIVRTGSGNVGVVQLRPGKIILLDPQGDPAGGVNIPGTGDSPPMFLQGGQAGPNIGLLLAERAFDQGGGSFTTVLSSYNESGTLVGSYYTKEREIDFANVIIDERDNSRPTWTADASGRVFLTPVWGEYEIHCHNPDGTLNRVIHRDYEHLPRTREEIDFVKGGFRVRGPVKPEVRVSEHHPDVNRMYGDGADGTLWVLTSRGSRDLAEGVLGVFDVFDKDGHYVREATLLGEGNPAKDGVFMRGDHLIVVRHMISGIRGMFGGGGNAGSGSEDDDEDAEPIEVISYRIPQ